MAKRFYITVLTILARSHYCRRGLHTPITKDNIIRRMIEKKMETLLVYSKIKKKRSKTVNCILIVQRSR